MNIAMMTNSFAPLVGGVSVSVERLARGLRDVGHRVTIFAPDYPELEVSPKMGKQPGLCSDDQLQPGLPSAAHGPSQGDEEEDDLVRCPIMGSVGSFPLPSVFALKPFQEFKKRRFDLIHVHHPMFMGNIAWALSNIHHLPLIFTWHTLYGQYMHYLGWMRQLEHQAKEGRTEMVRDLASKIHSFICEKVVSWYIGAFARRCNLVLVPSPGIKEILGQQAEDTPVVILPTGIPDLFFAGPDQEVREIRQRWAPGGRHLFCTVSRLGKEKNITFLLQAAAAYKKKRGDSFRLLVIGDGPEKEQLEEEANDLELTGQVSFPGSIPNERLNAFYHAADVFLFSSKTETQGIVLLEAMAAGIPVVALEASGVRDVVVDGSNGRLVNEALEEFVSALDHLCHDEETYRNCAQAALKTARSYSTAAVATLAENTYLEAIAGHRKETAHDLQTVSVVSENSGSDLPH